MASSSACQTHLSIRLICSLCGFVWRLSACVEVRYPLSLVLSSYLVIMYPNKLSLVFFLFSSPATVTPSMCTYDSYDVSFISSHIRSSIITSSLSFSFPSLLQSMQHGTQYSTAQHEDVQCSKMRNTQEIKDKVKGRKGSFLCIRCRT